MDMDTHKLLKRQLEKAQIKLDEIPENRDKWLDFIARVNKTYHESDKERYLNERSMDIFSREMMDLNEKLEEAQHIARLGYWYYDGNADYSIWSKELFNILKLNPANRPPTYHEFIKLVHEADRYDFELKVENALSEHMDYESEIRVRNAEGHYRWYRVIGQCKEEKKQLSGVIIDIHKDKEAEEKIRELNQQVLHSARRAGMAEVATNILHNIGNILNSSYVSIDLLKANRNQNCQKKLMKIAEILEQNSNNILEFLSCDPKGQLMPKYLLTLTRTILKESEGNAIEINNIFNDLQNIREIVSLQSTVGGLSSMKEKVYIPDLIDSALNITLSSLKNAGLEIEKSYDQSPIILVDKSKLLQILVNVIKNAGESTLENAEKKSKKITISMNQYKHDFIKIVVEDNGIGIAQENISRIFSFGFTTKENGHGFGLHSSGLSAQEMGGSLIADSKGLGQGAQFILTLPIKGDDGKKGIFNE